MNFGCGEYTTINWCIEGYYYKPISINTQQGLSLDNYSAMPIKKINIPKSRQLCNLMILAFVLLGFSYCANEVKPNNPDGPITISLRKSDMPPTKKLSELIGSIRLVALESKPGCYIGRVMLADQVGDKIFVMDYDRKQGVFVFDNTGDFLYNIGKPGKGPGEYIKIVGFTFSSDMKYIYLAAADQKKVSKYTLGGQFVDDIQFNDWYNDIQILEDQDYVMVNRKDFYFRLGNLETGNFVDTVKWSTGQMSFGGRLLYRSNEGHYLYSSTFFDTVYSISPKAVYPKYCFDFGPNSCTSSESYTYFKNNMNPNPPGKLFVDDPFLEIGDFFYFGILAEQKSGNYGTSYMVLNNKTNDLFQINEDDILFSRTYDAIGITYNSEFVSVLNPAYSMDAVKIILKNNEFNYPDGLKEKIKQMEIEDNPLLVFYTFK